MSAFLCSDLQTAAAAIIAQDLGASKAQARTIASGFRSINNASLACRYGDKPQRLGAWARIETRARAWVAQASPADRLACLACLMYQCDEGRTMETHKNAPILARAVKLATVAAGPDPRSGVWSF